MAGKELKQNVQVGGTWYGPDYPQNQVTAKVLEQITNPAAFEEPATGDPLNGDVTNVVAGPPDTATPADAGGSSSSAPPAPAGSGDELGVPEGNVDEVLDWVGDDHDRAQQALEFEQAKGADARKILVEALEDVLTK